MGAVETMRNLVVTMCVGLVLAGATRDAAAQEPWTDRGYVNIGTGVEQGDTVFSDTRSSRIYDEDAKITTNSNWSSGNFVDVGLGIRVWRNLSVGGAFHQEVNTSEVAISGSIPHPIFFNRSRSLASKANGLQRKESAAHLVIGWMIPVGTKFDVLVSGGPSFFRLNQDVVSDVIIAERGAPFTELVVETKTATRKQSKTGYNVGADATYVFWSNDSIRLGAGGFVRFTTAKADVRWFDSTAAALPTDMGGIQYGFGGRLRF